MIDPQKALRLRNLLVKHHSTGDWDFVSEHWTLSNTVYHSAPTSLYFGTTNVPSGCKIKTSVIPITSVKQGRIITWVRTRANTGYRVLIRWQDDDNYYYAQLAVGSVDFQIYRKKTDDNLELAVCSADEIIPDNTFTKMRITWWDDYVGLAIRIEKWDGEDWVTILEGYDPQNNWSDIGGRIGILNKDTGRWYFDDTDIYGVV